MKFTLSLLALCLAISLGDAVQTRSTKRHELINRPTFDTFGPREKRAPWPLAREGGGVKGYRPVELSPPSGLDLTLRKGEYVCGNKVCKLEPGVVPKGCNGICQYPIRL